MIIATHFDLISAKERERVRSNMEAKIKEMYSSSVKDMHTYPTISNKFYFVDVRNAKQIELLREDIYFFTLGFQPSKFIAGTFPHYVLTARTKMHAASIEGLHEHFLHSNALTMSAMLEGEMHCAMESYHSIWPP